MSGHLIRLGTIVLVSSQRMSCCALLECELIFVLESILWIPANEKRVDELFWRIEFHSSPSFRGPPPPFSFFSFSSFLLFMSSFFLRFPYKPPPLVGLPWVAFFVASTRVATIFDQRRWQNFSSLAQEILWRNWRVQQWHFRILTCWNFRNSLRTIAADIKKSGA